jgi:hypothetical protein
MQKYHLNDTGKIVHAAPNPIKYGRPIATVDKYGRVICNNHSYCLDPDVFVKEGEILMIWCEHDYFCCSLSEYENTTCR